MKPFKKPFDIFDGSILLIIYIVSIVIGIRAVVENVHSFWNGVNTGVMLYVSWLAIHEYQNTLRRKEKRGPNEM